MKKWFKKMAKTKIAIFLVKKADFFEKKCIFRDFY